MLPKELGVLTGHSDWVIGLGVTKEGHLLSAACDHTLRVWDLYGQRLVKTISGPSACVLSCSVSDGFLGSCTRLWESLTLIFW